MRFVLDTLVALMLVGLVVGVAIIVGLTKASEARHPREHGESGAIYFYLGFVLVPLTAMIGRDIGRRIAQP